MWEFLKQYVAGPHSGQGFMLKKNNNKLEMLVTQNKSGIIPGKLLELGADNKDQQGYVRRLLKHFFKF